MKSLNSNDENKRAREQKFTEEAQHLKKTLALVNAMERDLEPNWVDLNRVRNDVTKLPGLYGVMMMASRTVESLSRSDQSLQSIQKQAYFGRVDYSDETGQIHSIYVGQKMLRATNNELVIIDQENPLATLWQSTGVVRLKANGGRERTYKVLLKRQIKVVGCVVVDVYDCYVARATQPVVKRHEVERRSTETQAALSLRLIQIGYDVRTDKDGGIWVLGNYKLGRALEMFSQEGIYFHLHSRGAAATYGRSAWYTKRHTTRPQVC
ncbi:MAG: hypothetical protein FD169_2085 [Bacillota bacterium]|nr:MAG: hypothetical protein FD169_2085 [Bacillota bacterium]